MVRFPELVNTRTTLPPPEERMEALDLAGELFTARTEDDVGGVLVLVAGDDVPVDTGGVIEMGRTDVDSGKFIDFTIWEMSALGGSGVKPLRLAKISATFLFSVP